MPLFCFEMLLGDVYLSPGSLAEKLPAIYAVSEKNLY